VEERIFSRLELCIGKQWLTLEQRIHNTGSRRYYIAGEGAVDESVYHSEASGGWLLLLRIQMCFISPVEMVIPRKEPVRDLYGNTRELIVNNADVYIFPFLRRRYQLARINHIPKKQ
jgi:hypothetical protein